MKTQKRKKFRGSTPSPRQPARFGPNFSLKMSHILPKNTNFQKMKKTPQGLTQAINLSNFRHIRPFILSLGRPEGFGPLRIQEQVSWVQKSKILNEKKTPRDSPKCQISDKFDHLCLP